MICLGGCIEQLLGAGKDESAKKRSAALTQAQAIKGLGGIGKTQLAVEYAYRYRELYPFVFWVRAEHRETLITDFVTLAGLLHLPQAQGSEQMKVVAAMVRWLAMTKGWLLILDNADDSAILSDFLPWTARRCDLVDDEAGSDATDGGPVRCVSVR